MPHKATNPTTTQIRGTCLPKNKPKNAVVLGKNAARVFHLVNKNNVSLVLDLSWEGSRKHPQRLVVCHSFVEAVTGSGSGYLGLSGAESRAVISRLEVCPGLLEN